MLDKNIADNLALTIPIDCNKKIVQPSGNLQMIYYEYEAIRFIKNFRKNAGILKDNPIYFLGYYKNHISPKLVQTFKDYDITYIEYNETLDNTVTFISIPFTGYYFSVINPLKYTYHLRLDLDFIILREPTLDWVEKDKLDNGYTIVGCDIPYNSTAPHIDQREQVYSNLRFDTGFVLTNKNSGFYLTFYNLIKDGLIYNTDEWRKIQNRFPNSYNFFKEEFAVDYMYEHKLANIIPYYTYYYETTRPSNPDYVKSITDLSSYIDHNHLTAKDLHLIFH